MDVGVSGAEVEQRGQQQQRGARGPCLGTRRRREGHRDRRQRPGKAGEDLGQPMLEVRRGGEDRGGDRARRLVVSVAGEAGGDQRVVVRPDRPGVVAEWVVAGLARAEGPDAPAGVELLVEQPLGGGWRPRCRRGFPTTAGGRCWRSGCRPAVCRRRARGRSSRARGSRSRAGSASRRSPARCSSRSASASSPQTSRARRAERRCAS